MVSPHDWPEDLQFPAEFTAVQMASGQLPGSSDESYSIKLRFDGDSQGAARLLSSFMSERGWDVAEESAIGESGRLLVLESDTGGSAIMVFDADPADSDRSIIQITVFP